MTLYRATYLREGRLRGLTFTAPTVAQADAIARKCCAALHTQLYTLAPIRELQPDLWAEEYAQERAIAP